MGAEAPTSKPCLMPSTTASHSFWMPSLASSAAMSSARKGVTTRRGSAESSTPAGLRALAGSVTVLAANAARVDALAPAVGADSSFGKGEAEGLAIFGCEPIGA